MPPFVSFIIPTYNRAAHITNAIQSVLAQTDPDLEIIVVDDGSTDDTADVVRRISDDRVHYVLQENRERGAARNHGVREARGSYVYFLDSDDVVSPDHVAHARALLDAHSRPEVLHSRFQRARLKGGVLSNIQRPECPDDPADVLRRLLHRNLVGCYLFVRRDIALLHPYVEDRRFNVAEDWYLALVLACRYPIHVTQLTTRSVLSHEGQTMQTIPPDRCLLAGKLLSEHLSADAHFMRHHRAALPGIRAEMISLAALQHALLGHRRQALIDLAVAAWQAPLSIANRRTLATVKHALFARPAL
jgi:glycosyltransferase involved in cell wall biosynthesis